jgi:DNA polymerase IV
LAPTAIGRISYLKYVNQNSLETHLEPRVLFIDMNSFFASCEQQTNYYLRGRPVAVCVYTGKFGCVIAPSIEAKKRGIKLGLRLNEAIKICPDLVPLETSPDKYRTFHYKILQVLRKYSDDVTPKSIDEAVVDLTNYKYLYKTTDDIIKVAKKIKREIADQVGDYLKCSIGIAPNAFLAKLASDIQKPDGLTVISPENIDEVLGKLELTELPGIARGMQERLNRGGIYTPVELRHADPAHLKAACKSIVGLHWHYRLNFKEVDLMTHDYKNMSAMRHVSKEQRRYPDVLKDVLMNLCMILEKRLVKKQLFCQRLAFSIRYEDGTSWGHKIGCEHAIQDGMELFQIIQEYIRRTEEKQGQPVINPDITSLGVVVWDFIPDEMVQLNLFDEGLVKSNKARKTIYAIKDKYGVEKVVRASELKGDEDDKILNDVIGFGSIKDVTYGDFE